METGTELPQRYSSLRCARRSLDAATLPGYSMWAVGAADSTTRGARTHTGYTVNNKEISANSLSTEAYPPAHGALLRPASATVSIGFSEGTPRRAWMPVPIYQLHDRAPRRLSSLTAGSYNTAALQRSSLVPPLSELAATTASLPQPQSQQQHQQLISVGPARIIAAAAAGGGAGHGGIGFAAHELGSGASGAGLGASALGGSSSRRSSWLLAATHAPLDNGFLRPYHNLHQLAGFDAPPLLQLLPHQHPQYPPGLGLGHGPGRGAAARGSCGHPHPQPHLYQVVGRSHSGVVRARSATIKRPRVGSGTDAGGGGGGREMSVTAAAAAAVVAAGARGAAAGQHDPTAASSLTALGSLARRAHSMVNISLHPPYPPHDSHPVQMHAGGVMTGGGGGRVDSSGGGGDEGWRGRAGAAADAGGGAVATAVMQQPRGLLMRSWRSIVSVATRGSVGGGGGGETTLADCTAADCITTGGGSTAVGGGAGVCSVHAAGSFQYARATSGGVEYSVLSITGGGGGGCAGGGGGRDSGSSCAARSSAARQLLQADAGGGGSGGEGLWHCTTCFVQWEKFQPFANMVSVSGRSFHLATAFIFVACLSTFAPAALLPSARVDLDLSRSAAGGAAVAALATAALAHFPLSALLLSRVGPRYTQVLVLLLTAPSLACMALVRSSAGFLAVRLMSGASLTAFTCAHFWLAATIRAVELPSALATASCWGTAGAGAGLLAMPLLAAGLQAWYPAATAWRSAFYLPATAHVLLAFATFAFGQDTPEGDLLDRRKLPHVLLYGGGGGGGGVAVGLESPAAVPLPRRNRVSSRARRPGGPPSSASASASASKAEAEARRRLGPPPHALLLGGGGGGGSGGNGGAVSLDGDLGTVALEVLRARGLDLILSGAGGGGGGPPLERSWPPAAAVDGSGGGGGGGGGGGEPLQPDSGGDNSPPPPPPFPLNPPPAPPPTYPRPRPASAPPLGASPPQSRSHPELQLPQHQPHPQPLPTAAQMLQLPPPSAQPWLMERTSPAASRHTTSTYYQHHYHHLHQYYHQHHNHHTYSHTYSHNLHAGNGPPPRKQRPEASQGHSPPTSATAPSAAASAAGTTPPHSGSAPLAALYGIAPSPVPPSRPSERQSHPRLVSELATLRELEVGDSGEGGEGGERLTAADGSLATGGGPPRSRSSGAVAASPFNTTAAVATEAAMAAEEAMAAAERDAKLSLLETPAHFVCNLYGFPYTHRDALMDPYVWALALSYGCCFGSQLAALNSLPAYLDHSFGLRPVPAGAVACLMGLMHLLARPAGAWLVTEGRQPQQPPAAAAAVAAVEPGCGGGCGCCVGGCCCCGCWGPRGGRQRRRCASVGWPRGLAALWLSQSGGGLCCALLGGVASGSLGATVVLVVLFGLGCQMAAGMVLALTALAAPPCPPPPATATACSSSAAASSALASPSSRSPYVVVADVVVGGGLVGAVVLQAACFSNGGLSYAFGWIWMGVAIVVGALLTALLLAAAAGGCCVSPLGYRSAAAAASASASSSSSSTSSSPTSPSWWWWCCGSGSRCDGGGDWPAEDDGSPSV
ncbi:hypothetical protein PLESTB_000753300 [Pleodorina starrii]|uniref:Major facilitator superfamily (MFS) profile domain-containing protein n=1 Tax=Pleodorina starrii TaxID=330485 RepID=A0A9W6BKK7_9CHLO|nr:hypothetical protein PLESTB_000753300 [Pleodorina starrii]